MSGGSTSTIDSSSQKNESSSISSNNAGPPNPQSSNIVSSPSDSEKLDKLKKIIADRLNNYLEHRESSTRL